MRPKRPHPQGGHTCPPCGAGGPFQAQNRTPGASHALPELCPPQPGLGPQCTRGGKAGAWTRCGQSPREQAGAEIDSASLTSPTPLTPSPPRPRPRPQPPPLRSHPPSSCSGSVGSPGGEPSAPGPALQGRRDRGRRPLGSSPTRRFEGPWWGEGERQAGAGRCSGRARASCCLTSATAGGTCLRGARGARGVLHGAGAAGSAPAHLGLLSVHVGDRGAARWRGVCSQSGPGRTEGRGAGLQGRV